MEWSDFRTMMVQFLKRLVKLIAAIILVGLSVNFYQSSNIN